ncbi:MAG: ATP-dependent zinc protease [Bdellovibrionales bacterium]
MAKKLDMIGWSEMISLPELGIGAIKVKVDSGARTCALHATKVKIKSGPDGQDWAHFTVVADKNNGHQIRTKAPLLGRRKVRSSMGHVTIRPVIVTRIQIGSESWPVEVTLVNRDPMGFRMLLGRASLKGRYVIHPNRRFLVSRPQEIE